jgi:hypothetical protein
LRARGPPCALHAPCVRRALRGGGRHVRPTERVRGTAGGGDWSVHFQGQWDLKWQIMIRQSEPSNPLPGDIASPTKHPAKAVKCKLSDEMCSAGAGWLPGRRPALWGGPAGRRARPGRLRLRPGPPGSADVRVGWCMCKPARTPAFIHTAATFHRSWTFFSRARKSGVDQGAGRGSAGGVAGAGPGGWRRVLTHSATGWRSVSPDS